MEDLHDSNGNRDLLIDFENPVSDFNYLSKTSNDGKTDNNMSVHSDISSSILAPSASQSIGDVNSNVALGDITFNTRDSPTIPPEVPREPGIILLGRGNSFSLGRSEVILVNNTRQIKQANNGVNNARNGNIVEGNSNFNGSHIVEENTNLSGSHGPAPPTISNSEGQVSKPNGVQIATSGGNFDEMEMLWRKVESIMAAKQGVVQQVLSEFGIGGAGGGGEEDEQRVTEEESVWQVLQDNFQI